VVKALLDHGDDPPVPDPPFLPVSVVAAAGGYPTDKLGMYTYIMQIHHEKPQAVADEKAIWYGIGHEFNEVARGRTPEGWGVGKKEEDGAAETRHKGGVERGGSRDEL